MEPLLEPLRFSRGGPSPILDQDVNCRRRQWICALNAVLRPVVQPPPVPHGKVAVAAEVEAPDTGKQMGRSLRALLWPGWSPKNPWVALEPS